MAISRFIMEVAAACATAVAGAVVCAGSLKHGISWGDSGPNPGFFPFYIGCLIMLGSAGTLIQALLARHQTAEPFIDDDKLRDLILFSCAVIGFAALLVLLGLYVGTAIYLCFVTWWKAKFRPASAAALGVGVAAFFYAAFEYAFKMPLPKGPLLGYFGIY